MAGNKVKLLLLLLASAAGSFIFYIQGAKLELKEEQLSKTRTDSLEIVLMYKDSLIRNMSRQFFLLDSEKETSSIAPLVINSSSPSSPIINNIIPADKNYDYDFNELHYEIESLDTKLERAFRKNDPTAPDINQKSIYRDHINEHLSELCTAAIGFEPSANKLDIKKDTFLIHLKILLGQIRMELLLYYEYKKAGDQYMIVEEVDRLYLLFQDPNVKVNRKELIVELKALCRERLK